VHPLVPSCCPRSLRAFLGAAALTLTLGSSLTVSASADIGDVALVDGPTADIVGLDGVAMASDGTGGLVYRKRVDGRIHVFAARYDGAWQAPQRIDAGQTFDSTWPAIGAGNDGRLVVTWVGQYGGGVQNRMYSASLDPGAKRFQAPLAFDTNVGEGLAAYPSLAMDRGGQAYLAYRVVYAVNAPNLPPGTVDADVRVAKYDGSYWSVFGNPVDRTRTQPVPTPTPLNSPKVAIDASGNGVVAWQEPDDDFIARVYARRLFGMTPGNVLQVSPSTFGDKPLRAPADQLSVADSPFGEVAVAFRQQPGSGGAFTRPRAFVNEMASTVTQNAGAFLGARPVDGGGADGPAGALGPVSVSVDDDGGFDASFGVGPQTFGASGTEKTVEAPARVDDGTSSAAGDPVLSRGAGGALALGWKLSVGGSGGVALLERRADGTPFSRILTAPGGGDVAQLLLSGSGLGDALAAFQQGTGANTQIAASAIDAPPGAFAVATPADWTAAAKIPLTWDAAPHAIGGVTYDVQVDGEDVAEGLRGTSSTLTKTTVDDGTHKVQVVATDAAGQTTSSVDSDLMVDRTKPKVKVTVGRANRRVTVVVSDGPKDEASGVATSLTKATFGDGKRASGTRTLRRTYARPGRYRLTVTTADKAGNKATVTRTVTIR